MVCVGVSAIVFIGFFVLPCSRMGAGSEDGKSFKWDRRDVQPNGGEATGRQPTGDDANGGRFEGKAILCCPFQRTGFTGRRPIIDDTRPEGQ